MIQAKLCELDERWGARADVHFATRAFSADSPPVALTIVNISTGGMLIECDETLAQRGVGDSVHVGLPGIGLVDAEIRWIDDHRLGCELEHPIDRDDYGDVLAAMMRQRRH